MARDPVPGSQGYADEADDLFVRYEKRPFEQVHKLILELLPPSPADVLDIGAGTGRDAAGFAKRGDRVTAVEPTAEMRTRAIALHPFPAITWIDDALPDLAAARALGQVYDVVMMTAVWMHLEEGERRRAMPHVAGLLRPGGLLSMTIRHGPVPNGRRMFEIPDEETIALAEAEGLSLLLRRRGTSLEQEGVEWSRLAFRKKPISDQ